MIILLSDLQKDHLSLLHDHSTEALAGFCKLAIEFLTNGENGELKKFKLVADKLNVAEDKIKNLVYALSYLLVEGCKNNLSEVDFKSSLALAGFNNEQQEMLLKLYLAQKIDISECICLLQHKDPCYQDLNWRFEVQVSSKDCNEEVKPSVMMDLVLAKPKTLDEIDNASITQLKFPSSLVINNSIDVAETASECKNVIRHVLLRSDLPNMVHLANKLEQALKESKSQHVRKVQRALQ